MKANKPKTIETQAAPAPEFTSGVYAILFLLGFLFLLILASVAALG